MVKVKATLLELANELFHFKRNHVISESFAKLSEALTSFSLKAVF